jgi:IS5 family transposase
MNYIRSFRVEMSVFIDIGLYVMTKMDNIQRNLFEHLFEDHFEVDPELAAIDKILSEDESLLDEIRTIFDSRSTFSKTLGRHSIAVESIIRLLLVKHLYDWTYRFTVQQVRDSYSLRHFTHLYFTRVPHYSILCRYAKLISEEKLKALHRCIIEIAKKHKVTKGRKLRVDTTVVETNVHYPTDSTLLSDSVRVLTRIIKIARDAGLASGKVVRDFSRATKRQVLNIVKSARGRSEACKDAFKESYERIIHIAKAVVKNAKEIRNALDDMTDSVVQVIQKQIDHFIPLIEKVISQTIRRVIQGDSVPTGEKVYSIFEPYTYVVRKGKSHKTNEFGQVLKLQEAEGGIITDYQTYTSQPDDRSLFVPSVQNHVEIFGQAPHLAAADRGFYTKDNEQKAKELGVKYVCMPKVGKLSKERQKLQKSRWFKQGQRFRAGLEGRISVMKRQHGFDKCRNKGQAGFDAYIAWGVIAKNIRVIANA